MNQKSKHKASFVSVKKNTDRFKYNFTLTTCRYINGKLIALKQTINKIKGIIQLKLNKFDFSFAIGAMSLWIINAFIEGLIVNFSVWGLLGWRFNFITIMAWGFAVKQILDLYWRLRINGTNTKLPEKHNWYTKW